jgi:hypothetical protein
LTAHHVATSSVGGLHRDQGALLSSRSTH